MNVIHEIEITAKPFVFVGLGKQNMSFQQCLCELVDDAHAAAKAGEKAKIYIAFAPVPGDNNLVDVCVADWGVGLDLAGVENALQLGSKPVSDNRLNEHGMGLNNALSTLSATTGQWSLTSTADGITYYRARGPFAEKMQVEELSELDVPGAFHIPDEASTVITVRTTMRFVQTLLGRGGRTNDLYTLRGRLSEHLGIAYRGYLALDPKTMEPSSKIILSVCGNNIMVPPMEVPMAGEKVERFEIELGGQIVRVEYHHGMLDADKRDHLVGGSKAKYYYQGNLATQGIDIRLGKRVIATGQLSEIWRSSAINAAGEQSALARHPNYNEFVGELRIPELPRGILSTMCNKTGIDSTDEDWAKLFEKLNEFPPESKPRQACEGEIKKAWMKKLRATCPDDAISDEIAVWPTATSIDVLQESQDKCIIFELKVGKAEPQHIYQMRMYWDGLVVEGKQPTAGVLLVQNYNSDIRAMIEMVNQFPAPNFPNGAASLPYNLSVATHEEKDLA